VARRTGYTKDEITEAVIVIALLVPALAGIVLMSLWLFA
jgi:hypothetical protein